MTPATQVEDAPVEIDLGHGQIWRPGNAEGHYLGATTLREALAHSANGATVRVAERLGEPRIIRTAHADGIVSALPAVPAQDVLEVGGVAAGREHRHQRLAALNVAVVRLGVLRRDAAGCQRTQGGPDGAEDDARPELHLQRVVAGQGQHTRHVNEQRFQQ